jgi:hypothetical protein
VETKENESKKIEDKFQQKSVLRHLFRDFSHAIFNRDVDDASDSNVEDAAENNAKQVKRLSETGTIWHAVSAFASNEGKHSWRTVKVVNSLLSLKNKPFVAPWMTGEDRGIFGETPLHIALLFNTPGDDYTNFFKELWAMCPLLRPLCYSASLYHGENALHIAIIKKAGLDVIGTMVESDAGPALQEMRADGKFFKEAALSEGAVDSLGEFPLCFAACTLQADVLAYLIERGADLTVTTKEGNNLLHLLVLTCYQYHYQRSNSTE